MLVEERLELAEVSEDRQDEAVQIQILNQWRMAVA